MNISPSSSRASLSPKHRRLFAIFALLLTIALPHAAFAKPAADDDTDFLNDLDDDDDSSSNDGDVVKDPAFTFQIFNKIVSDKEKPRIILKAALPIQNGRVVITRNDGVVIKKSLGKMAKGSTKTITLKQPLGVYHYTLKIKARISKTKRVDNGIEFDITYGKPLKVEASPDNLDLPNRTLSFKLSKPGKEVIITFLKKNKEKIDSFTTDISDQGTNVTITWPETSNDVDSISIRVVDSMGTSSEAVIDPFWIEIPHQEVSFDTGLASWQPSEESKLEETLADLKKLMQHHKKKEASFQFYIAGYTDTVGKKDFNQTLSQARADAIARWFLSKGIDVPIYTQGFGEDALMRPTPDETPEAANRRALYLLGTTRPELSKNFPRGNWKRVN